MIITIRRPYENPEYYKSLNSLKDATEEIYSIAKKAYKLKMKVRVCFTNGILLGCVIDENIIYKIERWVT